MTCARSVAGKLPATAGWQPALPNTHRGTPTRSTGSLLRKVRDVETTSPALETSALPGKGQQRYPLARLVASPRVRAHVPDPSLQRIAQGEYRPASYAGRMGACFTRPWWCDLYRSARPRRINAGCLSSGGECRDRRQVAPSCAAKTSSRSADESRRGFAGTENPKLATGAIELVSTELARAQSGRRLAVRTRRRDSQRRSPPDLSLLRSAAASGLLATFA